MTKQMLLALLKLSTSRSCLSRRTAEEGSLAATLLIVIAIILGSLAIANRNSLGLLGSAYQNQSREARAAAEIGMAQVVSELNRNRNRQLLVNACKLTTNTPSQIAADSTLQVPDARAVPNIALTFPATGTIPTAQTIPIDNAPTTQQWKLISANCIGAANVRMATASLPSGQTGDLIISVQGQSLRGGQVVATSTIQQTLEVVPKCLDRSLNGYNNQFGNDNRNCFPAAPSPYLAFVIGTAGQNTGAATISGNSYNIDSYNSTTNTTTPLNTVSCIATSSSGCTDGLAHTSLNVVNISLPSVLPTANTYCQGTSPPAACNVNISSNLTLNTGNFASWPAPWNTICIKQNADGTATSSSSPNNISCSINTLSISSNNQTLTFNINGPKVRLHFPNAGPSISLNNGSGFATTNSTSPADLALFGCALGAASPCGTQTLNFGNGNSASQSLFLYFPYGNITTMGGNVEIFGVIWANSLTGNGAVRFTVPTATLNGVVQLDTSVAALMNSNNSNNTPYAIDYVTRAVKSLSYY